MKYIIWLCYEKIKHLVKEKAFVTFGCSGGFAVGILLFGDAGPHIITEYIVKLFVTLLSAFLSGIAGAMGKDIMERKKKNHETPQKKKRNDNRNKNTA